MHAYQIHKLTMSFEFIVTDVMKFELGEKLNLSQKCQRKSVTGIIGPFCVMTFLIDWLGLG